MQRVHFYTLAFGLACPCLDETGRQIGLGSGPFAFTNGYYPCEGNQAVHRVFGELPLSSSSARQPCGGAFSI